MDKEGTTQQLNQCLVGQVSRLLLFRFLYYRQEAYLRTLEVSTPLSLLQTTGTASTASISNAGHPLFPTSCGRLTHCPPTSFDSEPEALPFEAGGAVACTQGVNTLDNARALQRGGGGLVC